MKNLIITVLLIATLTLGCATNCTKCPVVVKPKVLVPTFACYVPDVYDEWKQKNLKSTSGINTEGELIETVIINIKLTEMYIDLLHNYRVCVEKTLTVYEGLKDTIENKENK